MDPRLVWTVVVASAVLLGASRAHAQALGDLALEQIEPAPAGDAFFSNPSPFIGGHLVPRALVAVSHASAPLVLSTAASEETVVGHQTLIHLDASLALWDRLCVDLLLPIALTQGGGSATATAPQLSAPPSSALGDLRVGARVRILGADEDALQLAFGTFLHVPTGTSAAFMSEGAVRDTPYVSLGGRAAYLVWSTSLGIVFRGSDNPSTLSYGGGAALLLAGGRIQVGPEIFAATPLQEGRIALGGGRLVARDRLTNAEALLSARIWMPAGFFVGAGGGFGLSEAIGTPAFRLLGALGWELPAARSGGGPIDTDEDGTPDTEDACPYAFGPKHDDQPRAGCPAREGHLPASGEDKGRDPR